MYFKLHDLFQIPDS